MISLMIFMTVMLGFVLLVEKSYRKTANFNCIDCEENYELSECGSFKGDAQRCRECEDNYRTGFNDEDLFI
jgi:hypothetical protein